MTPNWAAVAAVVLLGAGWMPTRAQPADSTVADRIYVYLDGAIINWPNLATFPVDSVDAVSSYSIDSLRNAGHLYAAVDSVVLDAGTRLFLSAGPVFRVAEILFSGSPALDPLVMAEIMESKEGEPLLPSVLEEDIRYLLDEHTRQGWPMAEAHVANIVPANESSTMLRIEINIKRGPEVVLRDIRLLGADRTRAGYVSRLTGLRRGMALKQFDSEKIRRKLLATNHFTDVGQPRLEMQADGAAIAVIPLRDAAPGNFDLVLGYVPETSSVRQGGLVGNGHLELRNLFGGGRLFNLRLNRLPGRVSNVFAGVSDPNVAGLPIGLEGSFNGIQQDSTYDKQSYAGLLTFQLSEGLRLIAGATREVTKPGQAGLQIRSGRQRIARSTAAFFGIGVRYEAVDWPINPRSGLRVESMFERGNKNRTARSVTAAGDTLTSKTRANQERLTMRVRYFLPTLRRQLVAIGADAQLVLSDEYDESDLIRFGGAQTLRGYNEEQFLGRLAARVLAEYRYQLDRYSFVYGFGDLGFLETAPSDGIESRREVLPGFGFGIQFRTEVGIINVSYAFNDRDGPIDGRVHVGLSFSL